MTRVLIRAIIASLIVALVVPGVLFLTVHKAGVPKPGVQVPSDFYNWSPHNQNEWNIKNLDLVGGIEYVRLRMRNPGNFATEYGIAVGSLFAIGFASCLLFVLLGRLRSNTTPHTDARDVPASAQASGARAGGRER
jgi:hypothetical protein